MKAKVVSDTGAYASLGGPVLERACTHAAGPYAYENFEIDGYAYYTNNPPAGAFRGFGVTQTCFAVETLLNRAGRPCRHLPVGDPLPQRYPSRRCAAERADRR